MEIQVKKSSKQDHKMSEAKETDDGHVTSTETNGKYLNPDQYEGLIEQLYSNRTPLELLHETCNKIGKDSDDWKRKGAKEIAGKNQNKELEKNFLQNRRTNRRSEIREDKDDVIFLDWYPASNNQKQSTRRADVEEKEEEEEEEEEELVEIESVDDQPQDLRCWFRARSLGGVPCPGSLATADKASSVHLHQSFQSSTDDENQYSSKFVFERNISVGLETKDPIDPRTDEKKNHEYCDNMTAYSSLSAYCNTQVLLRHFLELQSLAQATALREYLNDLQRLTLTKPSTVSSEAVVNELKFLKYLPDVLANQTLISQLRFGGTLLGQTALGGFIPYGTSILGGGGGGERVGCCDQFQHPVFDQWHQATTETADHLHRNLIRPEDLLNHQRLIEKQLKLQGQFYETESLQPISPDTSTDRQTPLRQPFYPKSQQNKLHGKSLRPHDTSHVSRSDKGHRRYDPCGRSSSSSDEISPRSFTSHGSFSRSFEHKLLSSKKL